MSILTPKPYPRDQSVVPNPYGSSRDLLRFDHADLDEIPDDPHHRPPTVEQMWAEQEMCRRELAERIFYGAREEYLRYAGDDEAIAVTDWLRQRMTRLSTAIARRKRAA